MIAVVLALGSSLLWGVANFQAGSLSRRYSVWTVLTVSRTTSMLAVLALVLVLGTGLPSSGDLLIAAVAGLLVTGALAAFFRGLAIGTMSVVAPISATGALIPFTFGLVLGDRPSTLQLLGIALAIVGATLAARERDVDGSSGKRLGVLFAFIAAVSFGIFFVLIDIASEGGGVLWIVLATRAVSLPVLAVVTVARREPLVAPRKYLGINILVGMMEITALGLFAKATTEGLLSLVGVLASLYPVVTVLLATRILDERIRSSQWMGIAAAVLGIVLITGGG